MLLYACLNNMTKEVFKIKVITEVAQILNLKPENLELHGQFIAKIKNTNQIIQKKKQNGKLILVSAISPTPTGEGKTTISIGLLDAFYKLSKKATLSLREPSMGPVFGKKGGATGAGKAQILPSNEINLHFTGDLHAISYANNLLCALIDNHIHQSNYLKINPKTIAVKRCIDINDRSLRNIVIGLGKPTDGVSRQDNFTITAASEIMAILCLANNYHDLKHKIGNILIGFSFDKKPVYVKDLNIQGAITAVLYDAFKPNLVQTLEGNPVFVHGGPFANIAHGCCSIHSTKLALQLSEFTITEAGFGADLGAEKFCNIKCRYADLQPSCVVLVTTVKALKYHGEKAKIETSKNFLQQGLWNLKKHVKNLQLFNLKTIIAINKFNDDSEEQIKSIQLFCKNELNCDCEICDVYNKGGLGATALAKKIIELCEKSQAKFKFLYDLTSPLKTKIELISKQIYGATIVNFSKPAIQQLSLFEKLGYSNLPVCICKPPHTFLPGYNNSIGQPINQSEINIQNVNISSGAGFIVAITEQALTLPGFSAEPAALTINITNNGEITGLH